MALDRTSQNWPTDVTHTIDAVNTHDEPTYENQLWHARKLAAEQGVPALYQHARVGQSCSCNTCFCCAALAVLAEHQYDAEAAHAARVANLEEEDELEMLRRTR